MLNVKGVKFLLFIRESIYVYHIRNWLCKLLSNDVHAKQSKKKITKKYVTCQICAHLLEGWLFKSEYRFLAFRIIVLHEQKHFNQHRLIFTKDFCFIEQSTLWTYGKSLISMAELSDLSTTHRANPNLQYISIV